MLDRVAFLGFFSIGFLDVVDLALELDLLRLVLFGFFPHEFRGVARPFLVASLYSLLDKEHVIPCDVRFAVGTFDAEVAADADDVFNRN